MYNVSSAYKEQIKKDLRNVSYARIKFGIVDPDAIKDATVTDNGKMPFAVLPDITESYMVESRYGTLEPGIWLLDGTVLTKDAKPDVYQSFVSDKSSDGDCAYTNPPQLTLTFREGVYAFRGLSLTFDTVQNDYPESVTIDAYLEGNKIFSATADVLQAEFAYEQPVPALGDFTDKIVFTFNVSRLPYHRLRVEDVILGIKKTLTSDVLIEVDWTRTNDLMNTVMPDNSMSFSFYDLNKDYNPDNPEGVWEYLESGQSVQFEYGYEMDDGSTFWMPGGKLYTDGTPSVKNGDTLPKVSFSATSKLQTLSDVYDEYVYTASGITLYDFADRVLRWAGVLDVEGNPDYILDNSLKNYRFDGIAEPKEARELLQLIANAGMCLLGVDRAGRIEFKQRSTVSTDFVYELTDVMNASPEINKYPYLKNILLSVTERSISPDVADVASLEVSGATNTEYVIEYGASTNLTVSVSLGLTLNETKGLYARKAILVLTGTGTVTVKGNALNDNVYTLSKQFNIVGDDCALSNPFIGSRSQGFAYIDWMGAILNKRSTYTFDDRGFPEIDEADIIGIDTAFTANKEGIVTSISVEYNGALSGSTEVLS